MRRASWTDTAVHDLRKLRASLDRHDPAISAREIERLILAARWLCDHPRAGSPVGYRDWRKWKPRDARHVLVYAPREEGIIIARVRHERSDWKAGET